MGQYNSTPIVPNSRTGEQLRAQAIASTVQRRSFSERSQAAYRAGRGSDAKTFSDASKRHGAEALRLHGLAERAIFASHNATYPALPVARKQRGRLAALLWGSGDVCEEAVKKGLACIDLHGLLVAEALARVQAHVEACREWGVARSRIITGRGMHSDGGVARIKPEVEKLLADMGSSVRVVKGRNEGAIIVELEVVKEKTGWGGTLRNFFGW